MSEHKEYMLEHNNLPYFIPNKNKTAWTKYDPKTWTMTTQEDFYNASPYSPNGKKASERIFNFELGSQKKQKVGKTYYGDKSHIIDRITFNKLIKYKDDLANLKNSKNVWQKYNDVPSNFEAYEKGKRVGRWVKSLLKKPDDTSDEKSKLDSDNVNVEINKPDNEGDMKTQLEPELELKKSEFKTSQTSPGIFTIFDEEEKKELNKIESGIQISNKKRGKYMQYPDSKLYYSCPETFDTESFLQTMKNVLLNDKQTRKYYCGELLNEFMRAKLCGIISEQNLALIYSHFPTLKKIQFLGSPAKCFQFAMSPIRFPDYFSEE